MTIKLLTTFSNLSAGDCVVTEKGNFQIIEIRETSPTHFQIKTELGWHEERLKLKAYQKVEREVWNLH